MDQGTGFVHIAPGHGADDFELGRANGIEVPHTVGGDGAFLAHVPLFAGLTVYSAEGKEGTANKAIIATLEDAGALLAKGKVRHSYPHSWRSKAPLIFRNTPQWFISMETNGLRDKALASIDATRFVPAGGRARLRAMIEQRPDWCVSRQRVWGVPLPIFVHKETGEPLRDQAVIDRVAAAFEREGGDAWFTSAPERFLGNDYRADDYEQTSDVVEVWFDSGSTHSYVLEARPELAWPALALSRGLGPAPWLVSHLAAGVLRHPGPRALRRGADPRLRARREGAQDVEVPGQRGLAPGHHRQERRRHPAPLGGRLGLRRGHPRRAGDLALSGRRLSAPAQHPALSHRQPARFRSGRTGRGRGHARAGPLGAAPAVRA